VLLGRGWHLASGLGLGGLARSGPVTLASIEWLLAHQIASRAAARHAAADDRRGSKCNACAPRPVPFGVVPARDPLPNRLVDVTVTIARHRGADASTPDSQIHPDMRRRRSLARLAQGLPANEGAHHVVPGGSGPWKIAFVTE